MRGIINIIVGLVLIVGGLTGKLALLGTVSGPALAAVGAIPLGLGIFTLYRGYARRREE